MAARSKISRLGRQFIQEQAEQGEESGEELEEEGEEEDDDLEGSVEEEIEEEDDEEEIPEPVVRRKPKVAARKVSPAGKKKVRVVQPISDDEEEEEEEEQPPPILKRKKSVAPRPRKKTVAAKAKAGTSGTATTVRKAPGKTKTVVGTLLGDLAYARKTTGKYGIEKHKEYTQGPHWITVKTEKTIRKNVTIRTGFPYKVNGPRATRLEITPTFLCVPSSHSFYFPFEEPFEMKFVALENVTLLPGDRLFHVVLLPIAEAKIRILNDAEFDTVRVNTTTLLNVAERFIVS